MASEELRHHRAPFVQWGAVLVWQLISLYWLFGFEEAESSKAARYISFPCIRSRILCLGQSFLFWVLNGSTLPTRLRVSLRFPLISSSQSFSWRLRF